MTLSYTHTKWEPSCGDIRKVSDTCLTAAGSQTLPLSSAAKNACRQRSGQEGTPGGFRIAEIELTLQCMKREVSQSKYMG